jgi:plastocyanin
MRVPHMWVAAIALVLAAAASACSASGAETRPLLDRSDADVTIISRDMAFDQQTLTVAARSVWRLQLVNEDAAPHNVAIYRDKSATETVFVGKFVSRATIVYDVPALEPGTYFFRCDLHPNMNGTINVPGSRASR